jgi:hypothetical protein
LKSAFDSLPRTISPLQISLFAGGSLQEFIYLSRKKSRLLRFCAEL